MQDELMGAVAYHMDFAQLLTAGEHLLPGSASVMQKQGRVLKNFAEKLTNT